MVGLPARSTQGDGLGQIALSCCHNGQDQKMFPTSVSARLRRLMPIALLSLGAACAQIPEPEAPVAPAPTPAAMPVMAWDHRPESAQWTDATLAALKAHGAPLLSQVPGDIATWCPGYAEASRDERAAFWARSGIG